MTDALSLLNMIEIPSGTFRMGAQGGGPFEYPIREVTLNMFWMDTDLVTNEQFAKFVASTSYITDAEKRGSAWGISDGVWGEQPRLNWRSFFLEERASHPVVLVSWHDAAAFAEWAKKRLPTEAEWERAAKGNIKDSLYPWGSDEPDGTRCNFNNPPGAIPPTAKVRAFAPNPFGLYDLVGNVWQWCADWFGADYYSSGDCVNPVGPKTGEVRCRRGGAWNVMQAFRLRCSNRGALDPRFAAPNVGFRCCK